MTETATCPKCKQTLPADAPAGMCPACLLQAAMLDSKTKQTVPPTPKNRHAAGERVRYFGEYELIEEIARGGMGVVWKAKQTRLNRTVALKMILDGEMAAADDVQRFYIEAEAAAQLQHPGIVPIYEIGEHDGQHFFSMAFVDGENLAQRLNNGPLPPREAARIMALAAEAVGHAHQQGIVHRDLKPGNIMLDAHDQPKVTDFGLAKQVRQDSGLTTTGAVMGTPAYMPPEQAAGDPERIGTHSDVYALGAVLYEMLTGRPPFQAASVVNTLRQVAEENPTPPRTLNADIPPDLETICLKCLEKSPLLRYQSAELLQQDLQRFLDRQPIQGRRQSLLRKTEMWLRLHPWTISAAVSFVLVAVLAFVYYLYQQNLFLQYQIQNPDYIRQPGPKTQRVEDGNLDFVLAFLLLFIFTNSGGSTNRWRFVTLAVISVLLVLAAMNGCGGIIEAIAWEGFSTAAADSHLFGVSQQQTYFLVGFVAWGLLAYSAINLLFAKARLYRDEFYDGTAISNTRLGEIREALLASNPQTAMGIYSMETKDSSSDAAMEFIRRTSAGLAMDEPQHFAVAKQQYAANQLALN